MLFGWYSPTERGELHDPVEYCSELVSCIHSRQTSAKNITEIEVLEHSSVCMCWMCNLSEYIILTVWDIRKIERIACQLAASSCHNHLCHDLLVSKVALKLRKRWSPHEQHILVRTIFVNSSMELMDLSVFVNTECDFSCVCQDKYIVCKC